jgi:hypothetical protein
VENSIADLKARIKVGEQRIKQRIKGLKDITYSLHPSFRREFRFVGIKRYSLIPFILQSAVELRFVGIKRYSLIPFIPHSAVNSGL